jgi:cell division septum initiation protein DivIVA
MDRPSIQRSDFPTVRRGYEPDAVDANLRHIADEVEALRSRGPVASAAGSQVQRILEAAETTADQLRADAGEEAREHVHRVSTAARELLERLGAMHDELGAMMDRLREEAARLSAELRTLERDVVELAPPAEEEEEPEPVAEAPAPEPEPEPVAEVPEPKAPVEGTPETAAGKARSKRGRAKPEPQAKPDDEEAARLVALDMALAGTPRDDTEQYLAEHYTLADPGAILDDVYALAGS